MTAWTDRQYRVNHRRELISKVVGVTFEPGYPRSAELLMQAWWGWFVDVSEGAVLSRSPDGSVEMVLHNATGNRERIAGVLIRDPGNEHDPDAVEVHVPMLESRVGFLPRRVAAVVSPLLRHDAPISSWVWAVPNPDKPEFPGIRVLLRSDNRDVRRMFDLLRWSEYEDHG